jgi:hypothetical protein
MHEQPLEHARTALILHTETAFRAPAGPFQKSAGADLPLTSQRATRDRV